jgi:hypothetical protein
MNMKEHILEALKEQFDRWEELLASLSEEPMNTPQFDLDWSIKDVMAHLWAWQQISIARLESGVTNREPQYPQWVLNIGDDWEENSDRVNALTFERNHEKPWTEIHQKWKDGFRRFLALGSKISERDLLDSDRYLWLHGYSLAFILVASYDHHQEHLQKLQDWLASRSQ